MAITASQIGKLAQDWIALQHSRGMDRRDEPDGGYSERSRALFPAFEELSDLVWDEPGDGWKVILAIHALDHSWPVRSLLSAGPIEDLLSRHGEHFISEIEAQARQSPSFASTLGGVWKDGMTDEVWSRLQAVWDRSGWDGAPGQMKD